MYTIPDQIQYSQSIINPWRQILYNLLKYESNPILITNESIYTADSIWNLSRLWKNVFLDIEKGDTILVQLPNGIIFLSLLIASLFNDWCLVIAKPEEKTENILKNIVPKYIIKANSNEYIENYKKNNIKFLNSYFTFHNLQNVDIEPIRANEVRFFLKTSGTIESKWIGITDREIFYNLMAHDFVFKNNLVALSVLPWYHVFGLILDLIFLILKKSYIIVDSHNGKDIEFIKYLINIFPIQHCSFVPLFLEKISEHNLIDFLFKLESGIIGGAKISFEYIKILKKTKLKVGYGQTEACPGISIGKPGEWEENYVGRPITKISFLPDGELIYTGENIYRYEIKNRTLLKLKEDRWVYSGDILYQIEDRLYFQTRKHHNFKLKNGKWFVPSLWEDQIKKEFLIKEVLFLPDKDNQIIIILPNNFQQKKLLTEILNPIKPYIKKIFYIEPKNFIKTPKGDLDRKKMLLMIHNMDFNTCGENL